MDCANGNLASTQWNRRYMATSDEQSHEFTLYPQTIVRTARIVGKASLGNNELAIRLYVGDVAQ